MRRLIGVAAGLLLCAPSAMLVTAAPAHAASGACESTEGVTVVVDYRSLGGGVVTRCAPSANSSGLSALHAAGFSTEGTRKDGPGFVCRINNMPSAAKESCATTPATSYSWSYFHASNGGSWAYSQSGAANRRVVQGGFEGWSFTDGNSAPPRATPRRPGSAGAGSGSSSGAAEGNPDAGTGRDGVLESPSSSQDDALPKPKPRTARTAEPTAAPPATSSADMTPETAAAADDGSSAGPWVGGAVVVLLLVAIAVTQLRRRTQS